MSNPAKCQYCKQNEAEWAMQFVVEDTPTFTVLGNHYRGFTVTKVCGKCQQLADGKTAREIINLQADNKFFHNAFEGRPAFSR
jgi:UDP-galactopyranose mutase